MARAAGLDLCREQPPDGHSERGVSSIAAGSVLCGQWSSVHALVQGDEEPKVQQKRALLVGEGVRFSGSKVSASSVVLAEELSALA